ncbi:MAG TPA: bifunctional oligoribonuclease/PAP phosphatase NrnA [Chloroflexota bacterium]|nr:bifunctional oligoribonuclease/PAP phosphatase NrnA [Chloroflexota bacterium]
MNNTSPPSGNDGVQAAADLVRRSPSIAIFSHVNPDGDSIGVGLGLQRGLRGAGHEACFAISDPVPQIFEYLPDVDSIATDLPDKRFDLMLVADCGDIQRIGRLYDENESRFQSTPILNLDHHDSNTMFGTVNYVDVTAASSSELAFKLLEELPTAIDAATATHFLTGIINDTGSFQHSNTDARVLQIAGALRHYGGDLEQSAYEMFRAKPLSTAKLWGLILSTLHLDESRGIVWAFMTPDMAREAAAATDESEGVVDYMSGIREAAIAAFLKEREPGVVRVSLRSHGLDVSKICSAFGGGGHIRAAGCTIHGTLREAQQQVTQVFDELWSTVSPAS